MITSKQIEFTAHGDKDELLKTLSNVHRSTSEIAVAERLAARLVAMSSADLYQRTMDEECAVAMLKQFAQATTNLKARLDILAAAEARLFAWAIATGLDCGWDGEV